MSIQLRYSALSDVGEVRSSNQDSGYAGPHLLILADGMGGPAGGDIASAVAIQHLAPLDSDSYGADDLLGLLRQAIDNAHEDLVSRSKNKPELAGLGTTCIAMMRAGEKLAMVHIGDSRAYLLHDGELSQVTTDHTLVQYLIDIGRITPEEARTHSQRNVILRALGDAQGKVQLDESMRQAAVGDRWLLSSDGLFGVVSDETIHETLKGLKTPQECVEQLVGLAKRAGGPDNITCIVCDIVDGSQLVSQKPQIVGSAARHGAQAPEGKEQESTPASRAKAYIHPTAAQPVEPPVIAEKPVKPRRWATWLAFTIVLVGILGLLGFGAYKWTQTQFFLAQHEGKVAIFRGIPQNLGPIVLHELERQSDLSVTDLPKVAQERLAKRITVGSETEATKQLDTLIRQASEEALKKNREISETATTPGPPVSGQSPGEKP